MLLSLYVYMLYLRSCKYFLHFCPPQQLLGLVFAPRHLKLVFAAGVLLFLPPPCLSYLCSFAATMYLFLDVIVSEHNCKKWHLDNNSCSLSIYHFPRCISLIYIQTCSRISQHSSVFVLLIVFRPLCRWISLLSVTSGLVAFSLSPTSIYVSAQLLCRQLETEVKVQIHRNTSLHCPQHPFMFQYNCNPQATFFLEKLLVQANIAIEN